MISDINSFVQTTLALIWCLSAGVCAEAQVEVFGRDRERMPAIVVISLFPVINTVVAVIYIIDKLRGRAWRSMDK